MSTDECRRRGRRTGAADSKAAAAAAAAAAAETTAAATAYRSSNGDPQQQQRSQAAAPSFPSVCRLIEKYTMLIERHRQQQEVMTPSARKKPSSSSAAATNVGKVSGEPSAQDVSSSKSSDPFGEEAAAWNRLLMDREDEDDCNGDDEPSDDAENYRRPREQRPVPSSQEQHGEHRHPSLLRFGCKSLGNVLQHGMCALVLSRLVDSAVYVRRSGGPSRSPPRARVRAMCFGARGLRFLVTKNKIRFAYARL